MFRELTRGESVVLYRKMRRAHTLARFGRKGAPPQLQIMFDCDDVLIDLEQWHGADVIDAALLSGRRLRYI